MESVTRYVVTHVNRDGMRTLISAAQGRNTFATEAEAEQHKADILANNSHKTLRELYGFPLEVRPCPCYPGHFDPQNVWFDTLSPELNRLAEELATTVINERDFYHQYAQPMMERHALLLTAENIEELRPAMEEEFRLLALLAIEFWNHRLIRKPGNNPTRVPEPASYSGEPNPLHPEERPFLIEVANGLRDYYIASEYSDSAQSMPRGGDLVRSVPEWSWGRFGIQADNDLGVMGGLTSGEPQGGSVTFNTLGFRGKSSKYGTGPESVSCSGGPATIHTDPIPAKFSGKGKVVTFWKWRSMPQASGGEHYRIACPIWEMDLNL